MIRCFVALGSNLDDPARQIEQALDALAALEHCRLGRVSRRYRNPAVGPGEQPDFINAVAELFSALAPLELLAALQRIETAQGRRREVRWGARTLDLDLLLYGDEIIELPQLQVPHPRMYQRNWVLYPLADLVPELVFPDGSRLAARLDYCSNQGLQPL
jgi:2-amino-4-hydroxy-6-hydroxymethyldihydropteridine diphosphokinase